MNELAPRPSQPCQPIPYGLVSLWDMLRFQAPEFVSMMQSIAAIEAHLDAGGPGVIRRAVVDVCEHLRKIHQRLEALGLRMGSLAVVRLIDEIERKEEVDSEVIARGLRDINRRIHDQLSEKALFSVERHAEWLVEGSEPFGGEVASKFRCAAYDVEEAGKCLALRRTTACAFHLMRVTEVGAEAIHKCLGLPEPIKDAERNWGATLRRIKTEIDERKSRWKTEEDRQFFGIMGQTHQIW